MYMCVDVDAAARTFSISYRFRLQLVVIFVARLVLGLFDLSSIYIHVYLCTHCL